MIFQPHQYTLSQYLQIHFLSFCLLLFMYVLYVYSRSVLILINILSATMMFFLLLIFHLFLGFPAYILTRYGFSTLPLLMHITYVLHVLNSNMLTSRIRILFNVVSLNIPQSFSYSSSLLAPTSLVFLSTLIMFIISWHINLILKVLYRPYPANAKKEFKQNFNFCLFHCLKDFQLFWFLFVFFYLFSFKFFFSLWLLTNV